MNGHPRDLLGAYADGELQPTETARVAGHLTTCTECARELALIRSMGGAMRAMAGSTRPRGVWATVHRRISRPIGWLLVIVGVAAWSALAALEWFRSRELTLEWLAGSAIGIGIGLVAIGVAYEQYREWKETRYKDIDR